MKTEKLVRDVIGNMVVTEYAPSGRKKYRADLSLNVNPLGFSDRVAKKFAEINPEIIFHYYPENVELLQKISKYANVDPSEILLGDGCDGCLSMIANAFIEKNDEVIIPVPTFHRYEFHTICAGGKPIFLPTRDFNIRAKDVLEKVSNKTKLIFLCDPNNPTGLPIGMDVKEDILKNFDGIVVVDEALGDMNNGNSSSLLKKYNNLLITRSFSKIFGLASLRIGYIMANAKIIEQVRKISSPYKVNGIAQELASIAIEDKNHIRMSVDYITRNREFLIQNLEKLGFKCTNSVTSNFLMDISLLGIDSAEFVELMKIKGVAVTDGKAFRVPISDYVRVSIGTVKENKYFIKKMKELMSDYNRLSSYE